MLSVLNLFLISMLLFTFSILNEPGSEPYNVYIQNRTRAEPQVNPAPKASINNNCPR